jgi:hypothetical protein
MSNLALVLEDQGEYEKAEEMMVQKLLWSQTSLSLSPSPDSYAADEKYACLGLASLT